MGFSTRYLPNLGGSFVGLIFRFANIQKDFDTIPKMNNFVEKRSKKVVYYFQMTDVFDFCIKVSQNKSAANVAPYTPLKKQSSYV